MQCWTQTYRPRSPPPRRPARYVGSMQPKSQPLNLHGPLPSKLRFESRDGLLLHCFIHSFECSSNFFVRHTKHLLHHINFIFRMRYSPELQARRNFWWFVQFTTASLMNAISASIAYIQPTLFANHRTGTLGTNQREVQNADSRHMTFHLSIIQSWLQVEPLDAFQTSGTPCRRAPYKKANQPSSHLQLDSQLLDPRDHKVGRWSPLVPFSSPLGFAQNPLALLATAGLKLLLTLPIFNFSSRSLSQIAKWFLFICFVTATLSLWMSSFTMASSSQNEKTHLTTLFFFFFSFLLLLLLFSSSSSWLRLTVPSSFLQCLELTACTSSTNHLRTQSWSGRRSHRGACSEPIIILLWLWNFLLGGDHLILGDHCSFDTSSKNLIRTIGLILLAARNFTVIFHPFFWPLKTFCRLTPCIVMSTVQNQRQCLQLLPIARTSEASHNDKVVDRCWASCFHKTRLTRCICANSARISPHAHLNGRCNAWMKASMFFATSLASVTWLARGSGAQLGSQALALLTKHLCASTNQAPQKPWIQLARHLAKIGKTNQTP